MRSIIDNKKYTGFFYINVSNFTYKSDFFYSEASIIFNFSYKLSEQFCYLNYSGQEIVRDPPLQ